MAATDADDPRHFFSPPVISRISRLEMRARQVVEGFISGMHKSPFFGHSVEFVQHREYVKGDDVRHLDWKAWSKTDRFYIKQFEAETNLRANIVVDVSESMMYGRGAMTKYDYGCTIAACLGYLIMKQQDSCGLVTFDSKVRQILPARSSDIHLDAFAKAMHVSKPREKTDIEAIIKRVAETMHGRGLVILISDFLVDRGPLIKALEMLRHRRHDVMIFHVLDADELEFPFAGTTRFEGMEEMPNLTCDPRALRDGYLEALEEYLTEVRRGCTKLGIDYNLVKTTDYLDAVLSKFLFARMNIRSRAK